MPSFVFTGLVETVYPFDRDASGQPLGAVSTGDVRDLDRPLDWQWVPAGDGQDQPAAPESPAGPAAPEAEAEAAPPPPAPVPDGPQPAPPAAPPAGPQPFAVTTGP